MSKKVKIILISILLFVLGAGVVNASSANATLMTDGQNIKAGETFTVTFVANCEEGINGLEGKISYDTDKLEFVKVETADATKWTNLGEGLTVQILNISSESIKESQIFKMTFKAKDDITAGTTANITVDEIVIDSEAQTDSSKSVVAQTISLNIIADEDPTQGTEKPDGDDNKEEDKEQETDKETEDKDQAADKETEDKDQVDDKETEDKETEDKNQIDDDKDSNVNKEESKDDKKTNTTEESKKDNKVQTNTVSTSTNTKKDNTTASKEYPKTGAEIIVLPIVIITISLIASYMGYKKYKGI